MARPEELVVGAWRYAFERVGTEGTLYLSVAHCGGMLDTVPRDAGQQAWTENALRDLPGVRQVSPTFWEIEAASAWRVRAVLVTAPARHS